MQKQHAFFMLCALLIIGGLSLWATGIDYTIQDWVAAQNTQPRNDVWRVISLLGIGKVQMLICLVSLYLYVGRKTHRFIPFWKHTFLFITVSFLNLWRGKATFNDFARAWPLNARVLLTAVPIMLVIGTICALLKHAIGRPRPKMYLWYNETAAHWLGGFAGRYQSMPSGHAITTFAIIGVLWPFFPRLRWFLLAYGILSAVARVMSMTTHFASDVLVGAGLGLLLAHFFSQQFHKRRAKA